MTALGQVPYLASFLAGILTFASPCVLPLIPIYISFITGVTIDDLQSGEGSALPETVLTALCFVLGFSFVFVTLGVSASYFGGLLAAHKDVIRWVGGIAVIIFGLHLSRVFKIKLLHVEMRFNNWSLAEGYIGSFLVGIAFAAGWTPCIGPILSSILVLASTQSTVYKGMLLLLLYSMGMGIPFLLTAVFVNRALAMFTVIKKYFGLIETVSGIVLVFSGVLLISGSFNIIARFFEKITG